MKSSASACSPFETASPFYGVGDGNKIEGTVGCVVVARFPKTARQGGIADKILSKQLDYIQAGLSNFGDAGNSSTDPGDPDFYAEFAVIPAFRTKVGNRATPGFLGYKLKPRYVYFGATAAKRTGPKNRKSLRVELELRRLKLDSGAYADKPYYEAAFEFGDVPIGAVLDARTVDAVEAGPPVGLPAPAELKSPFVVGNDGKPLTGAVIDPVFTRLQLRVIEAEDASFIMKAIAKASDDSKDELNKAAKTLSENIGAAIEAAAKK